MDYEEASKMKFFDLACANKNWNGNTELKIIQGDDYPFRLCVDFAKVLYGSKLVVWFEDNVVMIE